MTERTSDTSEAKIAPPRAFGYSTTATIETAPNTPCSMTTIAHSIGFLGVEPTDVMLVPHWLSHGDPYAGARVLPSPALRLTWSTNPLMADASAASLAKGSLFRFTRKYVMIPKNR